MKKIYLLLVLVVAIATSCKKPTTVQVVNNSSFFNSTIEGLDGTMYETSVLLYKGNDLVGQESIGDLMYGGDKSSFIEVEDYVDKAKVMFKFLPNSTIYSNPYKYTAQFYVISINEKNEIIITDETLISNSSKSVSTIKKELSTINFNLSAH